MGEVGIEAESFVTRQRDGVRGCVRSCGSCVVVGVRVLNRPKWDRVGTAWLDLAADAGEWRIIVDGVPGALDSLGLGANLDFLDKWWRWDGGRKWKGGRPATMVVRNVVRLVFPIS